MHISGPKSDPDNRIDALDRAFEAGIDDLGMGVLYGLYDYRFDTLAMLMHVEHLEKKYGVGPHTISVPRIEPAEGAELSTHVPYKITDEEFKRMVAILRLSVPYTGIIMSTRESPQMRDDLINMGVSQISAESSTVPGGYSGTNKVDGQFSTSDTRSLDEIVGSLIKKGFIPSYCAACYRKQRTGEKFMDMAKPGTIKNHCSLNALVTLKEYLVDFASDKVKVEGERMISEMKDCLSEKDRASLETFLVHVAEGKRDEFI